MPADASLRPPHGSSAAPVAGPPAQLFFTSASQRVALARERFFERGDRPTGLVADAIIQSWTRCLAARRSTRHPVAFEPVTRSRLHAALERNRALLLAAHDGIHGLQSALAGSNARVLLTDASGVIVHSTLPAAPPEHSPVLQLAGRVGVNLSEQHVGTNAPALVVKTGRPAAVLGAEHYFESVQPLHCAAAPIRDGHGRLAGVLDITVEARPFSFDAAALVGVYATMIENRLLQATAQDQLVLQFQVCSSMLGSLLEGLVGIDSQGRLAWHNGTAQQLLGLSQATPGATGKAPGGTDVEAVFGASAAQLQARSGSPDARPLRLPNGLTVWLRARQSGVSGQPTVPQGNTLPVEAGLQQPPPAATDADADVQTALKTPPATSAMSATLGQATGDAIARTLASCNGNISRAARLLGVSRGLLYRHLRAARAAPRAFPDAVPT